ncbi:hypothetical protein [Arthrobacter sp. ISL-95]|uniref:hypothetical protein n=1 Tax=Arthrobacter sp. ISL-95 TaxID=2819116 RepID=UPI001BE8F4D6|nr:hypothetical protein [Arthrobacter sp. ISL-95]MBT2587944.1 hypothetical protein [Arthrobacter sp. ISL-95]
MAVGQHAVVKAEKIAAAAVVALGEESVLAKTVERRSFDEFKGAAGDKITFRVEGTLPVRSYEWRNDRADQIVTDTYVEQTVDLTVEPNNDYSAVALIDEALEFDFGGAWGKLFNAQIKAVTGGLERRVRSQVINAPYERVMALVASSAAKAAAHADGEDLVFNFFSDVQAELKALRNPDTNVVAVVGSGWANLLRKASKSTKNEGTGDGAFASNVIDTFAGITAVEDPTLGKNEGYVYAASAFLLFTAAPRVPLGAVKGAISNENGFSLRWIQDYDASRQIDRSTFNSWIATGVTKDNLRQINSDGTKEIVDTVQYFVRGIKIVLAADATAATAAEIKPGDGNARTNGSLGSSATSTLAKVYNDQPFAGTLPAGDPFTIGHDVDVVVP